MKAMVVHAEAQVEDRQKAETAGIDDKIPFLCFFLCLLSLVGTDVSDFAFFSVTGTVVVSEDVDD